MEISTPSVAYIPRNYVKERPHSDINSEGQEAAKERLFPELRPVMASEDVKEGIQSFLERREAVFKGK